MQSYVRKESNSYHGKKLKMRKIKKEMEKFN